MKADEQTLKSKIEIIDENIEYLEGQGFDPADVSFEKVQAFKH